MEVGGGFVRGVGVDGDHRPARAGKQGFAAAGGGQDPTVAGECGRWPPGVGGVEIGEVVQDHQPGTGGRGEPVHERPRVALGVLAPGAGDLKAPGRLGVQGGDLVGLGGIDPHHHLGARRECLVGVGGGQLGLAHSAAPGEDLGHGRRGTSLACPVDLVPHPGAVLKGRGPRGQGTDQDRGDCRRRRRGSGRSGAWHGGLGDRPRTVNRFGGRSRPGGRAAERFDQLLRYVRRRGDTEGAGRSAEPLVLLCPPAHQGITLIRGLRQQGVLAGGDPQQQLDVAPVRRSAPVGAGVVAERRPRRRRAQHPLQLGRVVEDFVSPLPELQRGVRVPHAELTQHLPVLRPVPRLTKIAPPLARHTALTLRSKRSGGNSMTRRPPHRPAEPRTGLERARNLPRRLRLMALSPACTRCTRSGRASD